MIFPRKRDKPIRIAAASGLFSISGPNKQTQLSFLGVIFYLYFFVLVHPVLISRENGASTSNIFSSLTTDATFSKFAQSLVVVVVVVVTCGEKPL